MNLQEHILPIERRLWSNDAGFYHIHLLEDALLVFAETGVIRRDVAVEERERSGPSCPARRYALRRIDHPDNAEEIQRRLRLMAGTESVPVLMWVLLWLGAVLVVVIGCLFEDPGPWMHGLVTMILALMIASSLFLISSLDSPFTGHMVVDAAPFPLVLEGLQNLVW
jgi:hypothetical protein